MASEECPEALTCCLSRGGGREDGPRELLDDYLGDQGVSLLGDDPLEEEECIAFVPAEEEQEAMRRLDWVIEHRIEACWDDWLESLPAGNSSVGTGMSARMSAAEEEACRDKWSRVLAARVDPVVCPASPPLPAPRGRARERSAAAAPPPPPTTTLPAAPEATAAAAAAALGRAACGDGAASSSAGSATASASSTRCATVSPRPAGHHGKALPGTSTPPVGTSTAVFSMQTPVSVTTVVAPGATTPRALSDSGESDRAQVGLMTPVSVVTDRLDDSPDLDIGDAAHPSGRLIAEALAKHSSLVARLFP